MLAFPCGIHVRADKVKVSLLHLWVAVATSSLQVLEGYEDVHPGTL